jgi:YHS domain-containing protein
MNLRKTMLLAMVIVVGLSLAGCKKKEQPAPASPEKPKATASAAKEVEQTVCPVTGEKIDKNIFTVYKGKKVYFCMESCKKAFEADPNKYISKLPQFAK